MRYLLYFLCVVFAACGDGSGVGNDPVRPVIPSGSASCGGTTPALGSYKLSIRSVDEVEPNDDISTAYPLTLPIAAAPEDLVGIVIAGSINDTGDHEDLYSFTSPRTRRILFKLCESDCNTRDNYDRFGNPDSLLVWVAHFSVLDADGNTLDSTAKHHPNENYGELCIEAGVITYIAVHANDTQHMSQAYQVSAVELGY